LIPKRLPTFSLIHPGQTDTKGFMTFEIDAQPDQSFPRTEHGAKPICILTADIDRRDCLTNGNAGNNLSCWP